MASVPNHWDYTQQNVRPEPERRPAASVGERPGQVSFKMVPAWVTAFLTYFGYFTMGFVLILPLFNTFKKVLSMKSVGGGTRVEPFVASLLSYGCSFVLAGFDNEWSLDKLKADESFWIYGLSTLIYAVYLGIFMHYTNPSVRKITLWVWVPLAAGYLGVTALVGLLTKSTIGVQWMCMFAGVASSCTSLFLAWFVMERILENVQDWFSWVVGLVHYTLWVFRELDFFDVVQNLSGAISSLAFLVMLIMWRNRKAPAAAHEGEEREPLLRNHPVGDVEVGQAVHNEPPQLAAAGAEHNPPLPEALHPPVPEEVHPQLLEHLQPPLPEAVQPQLPGPLHPQPPVPPHQALEEAVHHQLLELLHLPFPEAAHPQPPEPLRPQQAEARQVKSAPATPERAENAAVHNRAASF